MKNLKRILGELRAELREEAEPVEELESIILAIEDLLDLERLRDVPHESIENLSAADRELFNALVDAQSLWDVYSCIEHDGLLSVFYNHSGVQLDGLHAAFRRLDPVESSLFDQAYVLAASVLAIEPDENWVMRNPGKRPEAMFSEGLAKEMKSIARQLGEVQEAAFSRAVEHAVEAAWRS